MLKLGELSAVLKADLDPFKRDLARAKRAWKEHGEDLKQSGAVAGAAIAAALGAGLLGAMNLDAARAKLAAQVGDPALAKQLGEVAGRVYARGFGESATEVMDAARAVMQAGLLPEGTDAAVIEDITVKAQTLATTLGADVTQAARAAGKMVQTGIAKDASEAFDILTRGMQVTGDQAGDLLDTFSEYSVQFREVGVSGPKAMGLIAQAAKAGARDLDTAADAIKEFAIRSKDGSDASKAAFETIGLDADRMFQTFARGGPAADRAMVDVLARLKAMKDPVAQDAAVIALFGTKAEDLQDALYAMDPTTAVAGLGELEGATQRAGDALEETASQKLEAFKRQAMSALADTMAQAIPHLEKVVDFLSEHSEIVGPLAVGLGALALVIGTVAAALKVWAVVQTVLNLALWTSPITWIVLGVLALVAVIALIATKTDWFQRLWAWAWGGIKAGAEAVWNWVSKNWPLLLAIITGPIGWAVYLITKNWDKIKAGATAVKDWIAEKFGQLVGFIKGLPGKISGAARGLFDGIKNAFRSAINWVISKWNGLSFSIPSVDIPGLGKIGGGTLSTPNIPHLASGGDVLRSGLAVIHQGERVVPAAQVDRSMGRHAEGVTFRFIVERPDGTAIRDEIVDSAAMRGQTVKRFLSIGDR